MSLLWVTAVYGEEDDPDHAPMQPPAGQERPKTFDRTPDCGEHTDDQKRALASSIAKDRNASYDHHEDEDCPSPETHDFEGESYTGCPGHWNPTGGYNCSVCNTKHVLKPEDIHVMDRAECEQTHLSAGEHARNAEQGHKHVSVNYGAAHHPPGTPGHGWGAVYGYHPNGEGLQCWMD